MLILLHVIVYVKTNQMADFIITCILLQLLLVIIRSSMVATISFRVVVGSYYIFVDFCIA